MTPGGASTTAGAGTYGRYRACRPLGTALWIGHMQLASFVGHLDAGRRCAPPIHSLPPAPSENARRLQKGRDAVQRFPQSLG